MISSSEIQGRARERSKTKTNGQRSRISAGGSPGPYDQLSLSEVSPFLLNKPCFGNTEPEQFYIFLPVSSHQPKPQYLADENTKGWSTGSESSHPCLEKWPKLIYKQSVMPESWR